MTTRVACHQGKERSVVVAGLYREAGHDWESFDGGIERMITLSEREIRREIKRDDDVILICEPWGSWDPQLKAVEQAEELLTRAGRRYTRSTTTDLMKALIVRR